jgi:SpoIID/LytB domain protein
MAEFRSHPPVSEWDHYVDFESTSWPRKDRVGKVTKIDVLSRGVSGRAMLIEVHGTQGRAKIEGELTIRRAFGGLRSSLFIVDVAADGALTFRGGGYGHGAGMCQSGAIGMSDAGKSHAEILRHYYSGSVLRKLW